jgi:hypothetical protein
MMTFFAPPSRCAGLFLAGEQARALEHDVDAELAPRQLRRIALGQHADAVAVDDHVVAVDFDLARELAVRRVVARQVRVGLRVAEVVDRDDLDLARAFASYSARRTLRPMRP